MNRNVTITLVVVVVGVLVIAALAWGHGGWRMGPGMTGGGYGMGPGMMGSGGGYGMGPGMMGSGGGYGMGPGMMGSGYGTGPGMMGSGHGMGPGMMSGGQLHGPLEMHPELAALPRDKQEQLRTQHVSMMPAMIQKRADLQVKLLTLGETLRAFPLDANAAREQRAAVSKELEAMFELHLAMMSQMQQIVGEELWGAMHRGRGHGMDFGSGGEERGPAGRMGPGMMGPRQPR